MQRLTEEKKLTIQILIACILVVSGLVLLFMGFWAVPVGEISASVLTAIGEVFTFAGALMGIDYSYHFKSIRLEKEYEFKRYENKKEVSEEN